jgi:hypothetical protein
MYKISIHSHTSSKHCLQQTARMAEMTISARSQPLAYVSLVVEVHRLNPQMLWSYTSSGMTQMRHSISSSPRVETELHPCLDHCENVTVQCFLWQWSPLSFVQSVLNRLAGLWSSRCIRSSESTTKDPTLVWTNSLPSTIQHVEVCSESQISIEILHHQFTRQQIRRHRV